MGAYMFVGGEEGKEGADGWETWNKVSGKASESDV